MRLVLILTATLTLALGFSDGFAPKSACATGRPWTVSDGCEWFQTVLNGQIKTCSRCCNGGVCRMNCN